MKQQEEYFKILLNKTREAIAEGKFINEAVEHIDKENKLKWLLHDYQHSTNVSKTYTELEWEWYDEKEIVKNYAELWLFL